MISRMCLKNLQFPLVRSLSVYRCGDKVTMKRKVTKEDVRSFIDLTGDHNPIHVDPTFAIVHGAFLNGLVSGVIGTRLPGYGSVLVSQTMRFPNPCLVGDEVTINVEITSVKKLIEVVFLVCVEDNCKKRIVLEGNAKLLPPNMSIRKETVT